MRKQTDVICDSFIK